MVLQIKQNQHCATFVVKMTMRIFALFTILLHIFHFTSQTQCNSKNPLNVGTTLFSESDLLKDCWSTERITLLTYRMVLEDILPSPDVLKVKGEEFVIEVVDYFKLVLEVVRRISDVNNKHLMLLALSDLLGGYLNHVVLPIAKFAYYGGTLNYENTQKLFQLFEELKCFLRTNGEGWEKPMNVPSEQLEVKPLPAETPNSGVNPCKGLIFYEHLPDEIKKQQGHPSHCALEIPMPFLDSKSHPAAIAVPFKKFSLRNLESKASSYVLVKFYIASHKCLAHKKAIAEDVSAFDNAFFTWINRFVIRHLPDEKLYAAFGGVLRVYMSLKQRIGHGGSKEIGNYNVMPEVEEKEPINDLEGGIEEKKEKSTARLVLYVVLSVIFLWFLLGSMYICYKIRANRLNRKKDNDSADAEELCRVCCSESRFSKVSTSWPQMKTKSPSATKDKKAKSADNIKGKEKKPSVESMKSSQSVSKSSSSAPSAYSKKQQTDLMEEEMSGETQTSEIDKKLVIDQSAEANFPDEDDDEEDEPDARKRTSSLPINSKAMYYSATYACHSSMAGTTAKPSSSTEDTSSRSGVAQQPPKNSSFVYGYEFQTSSSEDTPGGGASDSEEMKGNMSK